MRKIPESAPITKEEYEQLPPKNKLIVDFALDVISMNTMQEKLMLHPGKAREVVDLGD